MGTCRLGDVATVTLRPTPNFIQHEGSARRIDVGADVRGRDLGAVARDVETRLKKIKFPLEHRAKVIGVYAERQAAQRRLVGLRHHHGDRDLPHPAVGAQAVPPGACSRSSRFRSRWSAGVIGNYIAGGVISIGSLVGFFTVLGIVARNGIMMISHFQHLEDQEGMPFGPGPRHPRAHGSGSRRS